MSLTVLFLCALAAFCNGTPLRNGLQPRIISGQDAKLGEFPYQVSLQISVIDGHFCGGSLINENYVLTAAHCVSDKAADEIKVVAGTVNLREPETQRNVSKIIVHEGYDSTNSYFDDVALVKLESPISESETISFVTLPSPSDIVNPYEVVTVSGWGTVFEGGPLSVHLRKANIVIADQGYCGSMYKKLGAKLHSSQICAYDPLLPRGSCHGDSGSPLTIKGKVIGLVSWAKACALTDYPTIYTRVVSHLDWINKNAI